MRETGLTADETIEGSFLAMSISYTSSSTPNASAAPISPQPTDMEDMDTLLLRALFNDDREFPSATSSMMPLLASNISEESPLPSDSGRILSQSNFGYTQGHLGGDTIAILYLSNGLASEASSGQQSKQSALITASASLSPTLGIGFSELAQNPVGVAKTRTRRRSVKHLLKAPNPHGRAGKPRCELCRSKRQGCVYENIELPCNYCRGRGVPCTPKTWGPKREQHLSHGNVSSSTDSLIIYPGPGSPDDELLNSDEWMQVLQFQSFWQLSRYIPHRLTSRLSSYVGIGLYSVKDPDLNPSTSTLYRTAALVLMSYIKNNDTSETSETANYLVKYRREAQQCIENAFLVELVYSSYVVSIYSIIGGESVQMAIRYCHQFCKSFVALTRKQNTVDDWIELLWRDILVSLYYVHRDTVLINCLSNVAPSMESVMQWEGLLDTSYCLLVSEDDIDNLPLSMTTEKICHKVESLSVYMQISLDQFLIRVNNSEDAEETKLARDRLYSVFDRILRLVSHLSNISDYIYHIYHMEPYSSPINELTGNTFLQFTEVQPRGLRETAEPITRDTALALLYAFARLLKNMLEPSADVDEKIKSEIYRSAIAICRLCANLPIGSFKETLLVKRSLFWAGLILTESKLSPAHLWIKSRLHECIITGHHWRRVKIFEGEEELLDNMFRVADNCISLREIWKIGAENSLMFYYSNTLATWFFALALVRFDHNTHIGRSLEII